jgi:hypothetical protein
MASVGIPVATFDEQKLIPINHYSFLVKSNVATGIPTLAMEV